MLSKSHPIILFIDRFGFSIYQDILPNVPKFNFTPDLINNLDVVDKGQFISLITTFIQINKIVGSSLAVVLSDNIIYVKDLTSSAQKPVVSQGLKTDLSNGREQEDEAQKFLEDVPFEDVLAKVIKVGTASRIVAVNKDLVMALIDTFVSKGSVIEAVIPSFMYGQSANFTTGLTPDNIKVVLENAEILKSGNLLTNQEKMIPAQGFESELKSSSSSGTKKPKNSRQYILVGVFVILLIILGVVYFVSQTPSKSPKANNASAPVNQVNAPLPAVPSTGVPTITQALPTVIPVDFKLINIKISYSATSSAIATNLKTGLLSLGFQNVVAEVSETSVPENSSVIFSPSIPMDLRTNIVTEIRKILPGISILEGQDPGFTVNIVVGKS